METAKEAANTKSFDDARFEVTPNSLKIGRYELPRPADVTPEQWVGDFEFYRGNFDDLESEIIERDEIISKLEGDTYDIEALEEEHEAEIDRIARNLQALLDTLS